MDYKFLHIMYQQWSHGQSNFIERWLDFVELASKQTGESQAAIIQQLQKTYWFKWPKE